MIQNDYNLEFMPNDEQQQITNEDNEYRHYTRQEIWDLRYAKYNQSYKYKR